MKHLLYQLTLVLSFLTAVLFTSCVKDFQPDIDRLNNTHADIEQRVSNLETQVNALNTQLGEIADLCDAVEKGLYITAVATTSDGYELTLNDGHIIRLNNGLDNALMSAPGLSMTQIGGLYYWSVSGALLTDGAGNPIRTTSLKPIVKYDYTTLQWLISIDGGTTFTDVNELVSVIINDTVLLEIINSYVRTHHETLITQEMLFQIISTYIQLNYKELFNVNVLDQVVAVYIKQHYAKLFNYELLEKVFSQYNFEYYTDQIEIKKLVDLIVAFIQEHNEIFTDNEVLFEIISNYMEVNKTTLFTTEMLLEVVQNFISTHEDFIDIELLTQVVHNYIDHHRDIVFNTEVVRTMLSQYIQKYYVKIFSQEILIQLLNVYVSQNSTVIFNETLITEILNTYIQNNRTTVISEDILRQIVNTYVEEHGSSIIDREILFEVIANYFQRNYNLFIDHTLVITAINTYIEQRHDTLISVEIVEAIINHYLTHYYREVFSREMISEVVNDYFETNKTVISMFIEQHADPVRDVTVSDDSCTITLRNGQTIQLVVYDAYARLRDRVQSIVIMPNGDGHVVEEKAQAGYGSLSLNYIVTPSNMARVIADKFYQHEMTIELKVTDDGGNISTRVSDKIGYNEGMLNVFLLNHEYGKIRAIALHVKDNKPGGTDIMTEFTPVDAQKSKAYLTCPDDHHPHMIDLGLPSGTLWACCNVGASSPEQYGNYYAWGETSTKTGYNIDNYQYGTWSNMQNLGTDISRTKYDVAFVQWGNSWQMPTSHQFQELIDYCDYDYLYENQDLLGCSGLKFTGSNGGQIFLPAAGVYYGDICNPGFAGYYWSSNPADVQSGYDLISRVKVLYFWRYKIDSGYSNGIRVVDTYDACFRHNGQPVRPVAAP